MNPKAPLKLGKGVKLRRDPEAGVMLLVPEGALVLNGSAAAALELVDGSRTFDEIVVAVTAEFEVTPERARADLDDLFTRLRDRGFILE